ncbi:MAG TPA: hypothetical protein VEF53_01755 [Patescibacteria group bacterium]|nr:hypothetical protein [Patescibacteria group bacterium]
MAGIKFFSEYDISCSWVLDEIVKKVSDKAIELEWGITDVLDFHNVLKYISIERFSDYIVKQTGIDIKTYEKMIMKKIGLFIGNHKEDYITLYDDIEFDKTDDFFEIFQAFKLYELMEASDFKHFLVKENVHIYTILKFKRLTEYFDNEVKEVLLSDSSNAEIILSKLLKENDLNLPQSLTESEALRLIDEYIDSSQVNLNVLRQIITFPVGKTFNITDKIKLHASRKAKDEEEKLFSHGTSFVSGISISYPTDQDDAVLFNMNDRTAEIKVSRNWIEENLDYPTLWNNFIYIFNFVDDKMRLELDSKRSQIGVFESLMQPNGNHLYNTSFSFGQIELMSNIEIYSYTKVLNTFGIRLEDMIEWFFIDYLKEEFNINNFIVKMPSEGASYFEKCRTILPEIDRIFKQYNVLIEDGIIDQELIQMSSSSFKSKDIKSFNENKYVYSSSDWYKTASFLLFSDQSSIFYIPDKEKQYENFMDLMLSEKLTKGDFRDYQLRSMEWLFDNNLIIEKSDGYLEFVSQNMIYVLKELYYEEVLSFWHCPKNVKSLIDDLSSQNLIEFESSLLSKNEQDYFDYYLNKSKFTNGQDLRNRYLHGTNSNDEKQYEKDYYTILKLIVIIIIKINDDLRIKEEYSS